MNNGTPRIPQHQLAEFKCPECKDTIFEQVPALKFLFDRLDPEGQMQPVAVTMFRCMGCKGFLVKHKTEGFKIVRHEGGTSDGEEWKNP